MIPVDNSFKYPELVRIDSPNGRKYITPDGEQLASVTTILAATKSEESKLALENWAKRIGKAKADDIKTEAAGIGTVVHKKLEQYLLGDTLTWGNNYNQQIAKPMVETVIAQGLGKITKIYGLEVNLYFPKYAAGSTDLVVEVDGKIVIGDFKNSLKIKKEEHLVDYYTQLSAYITMHNELFGTKIDSGIIMMVARPDEYKKCEYKEFPLTPEMFPKYEELWYDRLEQFYSQK